MALEQLYAARPRQAEAALLGAVARAACAPPQRGTCAAEARGARRGRPLRTPIALNGQGQGLTLALFRTDTVASVPADEEDPRAVGPDPGAPAVVVVTGIGAHEPPQQPALVP